MSNMPPKKQWDRCCNPFDLKDHMKCAGLRKASKNICAKMGLTKEDRLCSGCRKMASAQPTLQNKDDDDTMETLDCKNHTEQIGTSQFFKHENESIF